MSTAKKMVVANLPSKVLEVAERGKVIVKEMTGNTFFPSPVPTLAVFTADINALQEAEVNVKFSPEGVAVRDAALETVLADVRRLVNYVQLIADADPDHAEVIINSSGFRIKKTSSGSHEKGYEVESIKTGVVILTAPANDNKYPYLWEYSTDATVWSFLIVSRLSTAECKTLTPGQLYYFRYSVVGEDNTPSEPSDSLSCRVK